MGFEELPDDDLIRWLRGWIGDVAAKVPIESPVDAGEVTVSVEGELDRVQLTAAAMTLKPEQLGHAIERAYVQAYQAALADFDQILDRIVQDVESNPSVVARIKQLRAAYTDLAGLKAILKRRQRQTDPQSGWDEPEWDPARDPLRRGI